MNGGSSLRPTALAKSPTLLAGFWILAWPGALRRRFLCAKEGWSSSSSTLDFKCQLITTTRMTLLWYCSRKRLTLTSFCDQFACQPTLACKWNQVSCCRQALRHHHDWLSFSTGTECIVIGWGKKIHDDYADYQSAINEVQVPIVSHSKCIKWYSKQLPFHSIPDTCLCAGYEQGKKDACQGNFPINQLYNIY